MFPLHQLDVIFLHTILTKMDFRAFTRLRRSSKWLSEYIEKKRERLFVRNTITRYLYCSHRKKEKLNVNKYFHEDPNRIGNRAYQKTRDEQRRILPLTNVSRKETTGMYLICLELARLSVENLKSLIFHLIKAKVQTKKLAIVSGITDEGVEFILENYPFFEELYLHKEHDSRILMHPGMKRVKRFYNHYKMKFRNPRISFVSKETEAVELRVTGAFPEGDTHNIFSGMFHGEYGLKYIKIDCDKTSPEPSFDVFIEKLKKNFGATSTWTKDTEDTNRIKDAFNIKNWKVMNQQLWQAETLSGNVIGLSVRGNNNRYILVIRNCSNENEWHHVVCGNYDEEYRKWTH